MSHAARTSVLTVRCADRPGIAAAVSAAVVDADGNIANADQHTDRASGTFLQRLEIDDGCQWDKLARLLDVSAAASGLIWRLDHPGPPKRIVLACSAQLHCAAEMLTRACLGELDVVIEAMVSDRGAGADLARRYDVPFHELAVGSDRVAQEVALSRLLDDYGADLVVLARYMRILPAPLTDAWWGRMINIHHSFLPAFVGASPHSQAHERGVKLIGATAHYVTPELDSGPIIAQDIVRVSHRDEVVDLVRKGRDVERVVLAEAVRLHLEHRVLMFGNRTCVFD